VRSFAEAKKRGGVDHDDELLARLQAGTSLAVLSPDPAGLVPASLRLAADLTLTLDIPDLAAMKRIIRKITGSRRVPQLTSTDYAGLDLNVLGACMRGGDILWTDGVCSSRSRQRGKRKGKRHEDLPVQRSPPQSGGLPQGP
jgi:hypothetical protein